MLLLTQRDDVLETVCYCLCSMLCRDLFVYAVFSLSITVGFVCYRSSKTQYTHALHRRRSLICLEYCETCFREKNVVTNTPTTPFYYRLLDFLSLTRSTFAITSIESDQSVISSKDLSCHLFFFITFTRTHTSIDLTLFIYLRSSISLRFLL